MWKSQEKGITHNKVLQKRVAFVQRELLLPANNLYRIYDKKKEEENQVEAHNNRK